MWSNLSGAPLVSVLKEEGARLLFGAMKQWNFVCSLDWNIDIETLIGARRLRFWALDRIPIFQLY